MFRIPENNVNDFESLIARPGIRSLIPHQFCLRLRSTPIHYGENLSGPRCFDFWNLLREPVMTGDVIVDFYPESERNDIPTLQMEMTAEGADRWSLITGASVGKRIAIVIDKRVFAAPKVMQRITNGRASISGFRDIGACRIMAMIFKAGPLQLPVEVVDAELVAPPIR